MWNSLEVLECLKPVLEWGIFMITILMTSFRIIKIISNTGAHVVILGMMIALGYRLLHSTRGILHSKTRLFSICLTFNLLFNFIRVLVLVGSLWISPHLITETNKLCMSIFTETLINLLTLGYIGLDSFMNPSQSDQPLDRAEEVVRNTEQNQIDEKKEDKATPAAEDIPSPNLDGN